MTDDSPAAVLPTHLGFIIDGNRRWAKKHGLPTYEGHLAGYNALKEVIYAAVDRGVQVVSVYTFSTENWKRAEKEVAYLLKLTVRLVQTDLHELVERGIRFRHIGSKAGLPDKVVEALNKAEDETRDFTNGTVCACFNYGGQLEIVDAVKQCVLDGLSAEQIDEQAVANRLYAPEIPPVDMVVRTSGEQRLSNFMLWRVAYSELLFLDKLWPEMVEHDVDEVLAEYARRERRYGGN